MEKPLLLWVKSAFSFRWGTDLPETLARYACEAGYGGLLLADTGGVYGVHRMAAAASSLGLSGVPGAEIDTPEGSIVTGALASGWGQLCRLVTSVHSGERVGFEEAFSDSKNLFAVAANPSLGNRLIGRGWRGKVFVPVLPGENCPDCPGGVHPVACVPSMYCRADSPAVHSMLRKFDGLLPRPHVQLPPFDCSRPVPRFSPGLWSRAPRALRNNIALSEQVTTLPASSPFRAPSITEDDSLCLRELLLPRLRELYGNSRAALKRLADELEALESAGLCGYFLVFHRILEYCRENGILAVARGSAAGSLVSRLLGLSTVCPVRYGLSFTRFFNRLRDDPPDIDLDIDGDRRDQVYEWFLDEWGERTAAVSAVVTYRTRGAVRVACAAMGVSRDETDILAGLSGNPGNQLWKQRLPKRVLEAAALLKGLPSHLMPHPCGVVVGDGPIHSTVPVETCTGGLPVTQLDMHGVERLGLIKMDLLGQRGLTALSMAAKDGCSRGLLNLTGNLGGSTLRLIDSGLTIGVPHIESPAMRGLLKRMSIRSVEDVARALALVRPGAASGGGRDKYMAGGERNIPAPLVNVLRENRGVMLYQENVSEAACVLLGLSPAEGDMMRRRLKSRAATREEVTARCIKAGFSSAAAERAWELLSGYAGYGFCKAHAMTYATVASSFARIKAENPASAMSAFLAAGGGFYSHRVYVEEARRLGLRILPPDANTAGWGFSSPDPSSLMTGLGYLAGMGEAEFEKLVRGRPYTHPVQVRAAGIGLKLATGMALAGCFDSMGMNRPQAAWCVREGSCSLFPGGMPPPSLPGFSSSARAEREMELMEITTEAHPLVFMERPAGTVPIVDMPLSGTAWIWGRVLNARGLKGGAGFMMLEDETGVADLFVPPPFFARACIILRRPGSTLTLSCRISAERTVVCSLED